MNSKSIKSFFSSINLCWVALGGIGLVVMALCTSFFVWRVDGQMRKELLARTQLVAHMVNAEDIKALSGTEADIALPEYLRIKERLTVTRQDINNCKYLYLMGRKDDGTVFFFVDPHPQFEDAESSPALPGDLYDGVSLELQQVFDAGEPFVEGPLPDEWGTWVSAVIPIICEQTGEVLAVLDADIDASDWGKDIAVRSVVPVVFVFVLLVAIMSVFFSICDTAPTSKPIMLSLMIPLCIVLVLLVGFFVAILVSMQKNNLYEDDQHMYTLISDDMAEELKERSKLLSVLQEIIVLDSGLREALKAQDQERLLADYAKVFQELKMKHNITHFYFHRPDRVNLLRVHKPEKDGDLINRFTAREAERTGKIASGIELGPLGTFTLRVVRPVYDGDILVGYIEMGQEIEDVLENIAKVHKVDTMTTINKNFVLREGWEEGMEMLGRDADWNRFLDVVIIHSSLSRFPPKFNQFLKGGAQHIHYKVTGEVSFEGRLRRIVLIPLTDVSGKEVGDVIIMNDISEIDAAFKRIVIVIVATAMALLALLFAFLYVLLSRTDRGIRGHQAELQQVNNNIIVANQQLKADEQQLKSVNQQLLARENELQEVILSMNNLNKQLKDNEQQLQASNRELLGREQELKKSEQELKKKIEDMDHLNSVMIEREFRVIEIKKEINELCRESGKPDRYTEGL